MYFDPWMIIFMSVVFGWLVGWNRRRGFEAGLKEGIHVGFDGCIVVLKEQDIIKEENGHVLPGNFKIAQNKK